MNTRISRAARELTAQCITASWRPEGALGETRWPVARRLVAFTGLAASLSGCAIVSSSPESPTDRVGVAYMLPKALLPAQLTEADGVLLLRVMPPTLIGDPAQRYLLRNQVNATSADDVTIEVDPSTGLLFKITAHSTDETLNVIKEAIAFGRARNTESAAAGETLLFSGLYDPDLNRDQDFNTRLRASLKARVRNWESDCGADAAKDAKCGQTPLRKQLLASEDIFVEVCPLDADCSGVKEKPTAPFPRLPASASGSTREPPGAAPASVPAPVPAAASAPSGSCELGACYRSLQPFVVRLKIGELMDQSTVIQLPNRGAPIAIPLERAAFVKTEHTVEFERGQLKSAHTVRPSSALALVKWPLDIYRSILLATSELVRIRVGQNAEEVKLAQSQLTTEQELIKIRDQMATARETESSMVPPVRGLTGPARGNALLAAEFGERRPRNQAPPNIGVLAPAPAPAPAPAQGLGTVPTIAPISPSPPAAPASAAAAGARS